MDPSSDKRPPNVPTLTREAFEASHERLREALVALVVDLDLGQEGAYENLEERIGSSKAFVEVEAALAANRKFAYHNRPDVVELHRVMGGYIETFSSLITSMRQSIGLYFAMADDRSARPLLDIMFSTMTAKPISDAFFAMSTHVAELDGGEVTVRNSLRKRVEGHIGFRNDLVHADWSVGWIDDNYQPLPNAAYKIKSRSGVPTISSLDIGTEEIMEQINDLIDLVTRIVAFGTACRQSQLGRGRVSELLAASRKAWPSPASTATQKAETYGGRSKLSILWDRDLDSR